MPLSKKGELIRAGPGTGKTQTIIDKIGKVLEEGADPSQILVITFTTSTVSEVMERLYDHYGSRGLLVNVHTFHSFALSYLDVAENSVIPQSLKRFVIYDLIVKEKAFTYGPHYLKRDILSSTMAFIDYLKCYGITPDDIQTKKPEILHAIKAASSKSSKKSSFEDVEHLLYHLTSIYKAYERFKAEHNLIDYTDMLLKFIEEYRGEVFPYSHVFVDELQDANILEAEVAKIAANVGIEDKEAFLVLVGDAKQSIFGFQGGSLANFKNFSKMYPKHTLTTNHRSKRAIVEYSTWFLERNSRDDEMIQEAKALQPKEEGGEVYFIHTDDDNLEAFLLHIVEKYKGKELAFITRTNDQAERISRILEARGVVHYCSAPKSGSVTVKEGILTLLDSLFHYDDDSRLINGLASPFSGVNLHGIFSLYALNREKNKGGYDVKITYEDIKGRGEFKPFVEMVDLVNFSQPDRETLYKGLDRLFKERILPVSVSFGRDGLLTATKIYEAVVEFFEQYDVLGIHNLFEYLSLVDISDGGAFAKKGVSVITAHKAKGLTFDVVVYFPAKGSRGYAAIESIQKAILQTLVPDVYNPEEINEEGLRVDYVAFTRPKDVLFVALEDALVSGKDKNKVPDYISFDGIKEYKLPDNLVLTSDEESFYHRHATAFSTTVKYLNGDVSADELIRSLNKCIEKKNWLKDTIRDRLKANLSKMSYSSISSASDIFLRVVLSVPGQETSALSFGNAVHNFYDSIFRVGREPANEDEELWKKHWEACVAELKKEDPSIVQISAEEKIEAPASLFRDVFESIPEWVKIFKAKVDAVFKGEYLWLVDYKTSKNYKDYKSDHFKQLAFYRLLYSRLKGIDPNRIRLAVFYVTLRSNVTDEEGNPIYSYKVEIVPEVKKGKINLPVSI